MTLPDIKDHLIDRTIQQYRKVDDIYCEPNLLTIMVLSCGRHKITKECLNKFFISIFESKACLNYEFIFLEQGWDINYRESELNLSFFKELSMDRKIIIINDKNYGINCAINNMRRISRGEYILLLENDWLLDPTKDWLFDVMNIFKENKNVGLVQLRALNDYHGNHGLGKPDYNPFSCMYFNVIIKDNYYLSKFKYPINNNPAIWRKEIYNELGDMPEPELWSDLRHGETEYEQRWVDKGFYERYFVAHPIEGVFYHHR